MVFQIWIQCPKRQVKHIKTQLETRSLLSKEDKIRPHELLDDMMLIPTTARYISEDEFEVSKAEILENLSWGVMPQSMEIVFLPIQPDATQGKDLKTSVIVDAVTRWSSILEPLEDDIDVLLFSIRAEMPKRWSVYRPMLLLPAGSFQSNGWQTIFTAVTPAQRNDLWVEILDAVSKKDGGEPLTHLAVNSGIPANTSLSAKADGENIRRSPSGLILLYGDFGSSLGERHPTDKDLEEAFWVSTRQNGIYQTWAPRYTMFSRGNIKEKARILGFHDSDTALTKARREMKDHLTETCAVDLYAGIGYFAFSYAQIGMGRVLCWEINPWSIEGLRRGAGGNGWDIMVVKGADLEKPLWELLDNNHKIVVFEESNEKAAAKIEALRKWEDVYARSNGRHQLGEVLHVNCGFLPSSEGSWETAWRVISRKIGGWLHLHENVGVAELATRELGIEEKFGRYTNAEGRTWFVKVEHVERVKTFAPAVWHCVFDVHIVPNLTVEVLVENNATP